MAESHNLSVKRIRYPLKMRLLRVAKVSRELPHFVSVTLTGEDLHDFDSQSFDDHVKIFFPQLGDEKPDMPQIGSDGWIFSEDQPRPIMREYTPRSFNTSTCELRLDFALHESGVATSWAKQAEVGQYLGICGPRGSLVISKDYDWHFLIGDETAYSGIARRLEELPKNTLVHVFIAVKDETAQLPLHTQAQLQINWIYHHGAPVGNAFVESLSNTPLPDGEGYVWAAGESSDIKAIYEHLVKARGIDKKRVRAASYWKRGTQGAHEVLGEVLGIEE